MQNNEQKPVDEKEGINVDNVTFDQDGNVDGLSDDALDSIAGGIMSDSEDVNGNCGCTNNC